MPTTRSKRMALARLLVAGCASVFGAGLMIVPGQAQYVPPPAPPPPPPVFNPPSPDRTVPQPSYTPLSPSTPSTAPESSGPESTVPGPEVTSPANEAPPSTTAHSGRGASVAKRSIHHQHHHHHRHRFAGYTLGSYCGGSPCVRIRPSAFYEGPASGLWWPGFYDYAEGQFARGHPRYGGASRPSGYHGD
jgi:hypothetical protein